MYGLGWINVRVPLDSWPLPKASAAPMAHDRSGPAPKRRTRAKHQGAKAKRVKLELGAPACSVGPALAASLPLPPNLQDLQQPGVPPALLPEEVAGELSSNNSASESEHGPHDLAPPGLQEEQGQGPEQEVQVEPPHCLSEEDKAVAALLTKIKTSVVTYTSMRTHLYVYRRREGEDDAALQRRHRKAWEHAVVLGLGQIRKVGTSEAFHKTHRSTEVDVALRRLGLPLDSWPLPKASAAPMARDRSGPAPKRRTREKHQGAKAKRVKLELGAPACSVDPALAASDEEKTDLPLPPNLQDLQQPGVPPALLPEEVAGELSSNNSASESEHGPHDLAPSFILFGVWDSFTFAKRILFSSWGNVG